MELQASAASGIANSRPKVVKLDAAYALHTACNHLDVYFTIRIADFPSQDIGHWGNCGFRNALV